MDCPGIYYLQDPRTFEIRYVGLSKVSWHKRAHQHFRPCLMNKNFPVYKWIKKLTELDLNPIVGCIQEFSSISDGELAACERYWISYFLKNGNSLLNCNEGGQLGLQKSKEVLAKISESKIGNKNPAFGKPSHLRTKIIDSNGVIYKSQHEAEEKTGISKSLINQCLRGRISHAKGLSFSYDVNSVPIFRGLHKNQPKKILCVTDNKIFQSITKAAIFYGVTGSAIGNHLAGRTSSCCKKIFIYQEV